MPEEGQDLLEAEDEIIEAENSDVDEGDDRDNTSGVASPNIDTEWAPAESAPLSRPFGPTVEARSGRKRRVVVVEDDRVCADNGCEKLIQDDSDLLKCDSPGCTLMVSASLRSYGIETQR